MQPVDLAQQLTAVRALHPLVHNITNYVAMDISANALLALGAAPAMVHAPEECEEFVSIAHTLVVNIGTLSTPWIGSMHAAVDRAVSLRKRWVLDPVGAGATRLRTETSRALVDKHPTAIRGNASEILAIAQGLGSTRGVDAGDRSEAAVEVAKELARRSGAIVAITGETDFVTDGRRLIALRDGHPVMTRVTAVGCSLSAIVGAFLATGADPLLATAAAVAFVGVVGKVAARTSSAPGSFRVAWLDGMATLTPEQFAEHVTMQSEG